MRTWSNRSTGDAEALFLDVYDLALAKLAAYREKDRSFVAALLDAGLLDIDVLVRRAQDLPVETIAVARINGFLRLWTTNAGDR